MAFQSAGSKSTGGCQFGDAATSSKMRREASVVRMRHDVAEVAQEIGIDRRTVSRLYSARIPQICASREAKRVPCQARAMLND